MLRLKRHGKYRLGQAYRKNTGHDPLTVEERDVREERRWWKHRCKDWRHGPGWRHGHRGRKYIVTLCNRTERHWAKQELHHERYDSLGLHWRKDMHDPWDWD